MVNYNEFASLVVEMLGNDNVFLNEPMKNHITFKVGGEVDILATPNSYKETQDLIILAKKYHVPFIVIGKGSNLLVRDGGIRGLVIKLTKLDNIISIGDKIICGTGAYLWDVSQFALEKELSGFEFASGIPGCVGGGVTMNAGAYISEMANVVESVLVVDRDGVLKNLTLEELEMGYRMSNIIKYDYIVLEVVFKLKKSKYSEIEEKIDDFQRRRQDKQPLEYPSAGSTFKRPEGYFAAKLIEDSGLKGFSIGGASVSSKHSGFIINSNNATAKDILDLIEHVRNTVRHKFNVELHTEVRIVGEDKKSKVI